MRTIILSLMLAACHDKDADTGYDGPEIYTERVNTLCDIILAKPMRQITTGVRDVEDIAWYEFDVSDDGWITYFAPNTVVLDEKTEAFYLVDDDSCPADWSARLIWTYYPDYSDAID